MNTHSVNIQHGKESILANGCVDALCGQKSYAPELLLPAMLVMAQAEQLRSVVLWALETIGADWAAVAG